MIATHLAERMSISNVLQTEIIENVMQNLFPELFNDNFKFDRYENEEELISNYEQRCKITRRGANTDMNKALSEGKPLIVEGYTVDPNLYLQKQNSKAKPESDEKIEKIKEILVNRNSSAIDKEKIIEMNVSNHLEDKFKISAEYPHEGVPVSIATKFYVLGK